MKFWDLIRIANRNLFRARLRTFLTVMAIFIGSFTLTLTNGLGGGLIIVTHDADLAAKCERVIEMKDGRIMDTDNG